MVPAIVKHPHPLTLTSYRMEFTFSKFADYHLTVTEMMSKDLTRILGTNTNIRVCYDHPVEGFHKLAPNVKHSVSRVTCTAISYDVIPFSF